jgi:hypothetical protein
LFRFREGSKHGRCLDYFEGKARVMEFDHDEQRAGSPDPVSVSRLPEDERPETLNSVREVIRR